MQKSLIFILIVMPFLFLCFSVNAQEEQGRSYYDMGVFAYEDKDYAAAAENFKQALHLSPDDAYYNHYLGKTYMNMELYDKAKKYFERAMEINPNVEELKYDYAFLHYKTSNYEISADLFTEIATEDPSIYLPNITVASACTKPNATRKP